MRERTCLNCGWVHMGVTRAFAEAAIEQSLRYLRALDEEQRQMFGPDPCMEDYELCWCGADYKQTRDYQEGDCPEGCTLNPILLPED